METKSKKLYRSTNNRMLAGICGGLAEYFSIDPTIVRLVAVLGFMASFSALFLAYLVLWVVIPENPTTIL